MNTENDSNEKYTSESELKIINDRNNSTTIGELKETLSKVPNVYNDHKVFVWNDDGTEYSPKTIGMAMNNNTRYLNENTGHEIFTLTQSS